MVGLRETSDSVWEPTASTSSYVDGRGTNLPSIHTLRLPGPRQVSDQQPGPSNTFPNEVAVEEGWSGYVEASDSVSEPTASTSNSERKQKEGTTKDKEE